MSIKVIEKKVLSSDREHQLAGVVYLPDSAPKGLFHVVHGMTEHIGRYERFMRDLAAAGYITYGYDNLGHGKTARNESELGYIAPQDGWKLLVKDVEIFDRAMRAEYGEELPLTLMGHSMGSFIVRLSAEMSGYYDKLIIMGTGGPNPAAGAAIKRIDMMIKSKGDRAYSTPLEKVAFGTYNIRFRNEQDQRSWLTKDVSVRRAYDADPFCTFRFTLSAMRDLLTLTKESNRRDWPRSIDHHKPILLLSGAEDPVGGNTKGVMKVYNNLKAAGANVAVLLYPNCRHEILNDDSYPRVLEDILSFIE